MDFSELAKAIDEMRETLRAIIAALVEDGFTDAQARELVVAMFTNRVNGAGDDD